MMISSQAFIFAAVACLFSFNWAAKLDYDLAVTSRSNLVPDEDLSIRADGQEPGTFTPPGDFNGLVSWQDWSSKDGINTGKDADGIWYIRELVELLLERMPVEKRTGVFWTGGNQSPKVVEAFIETELRGNGMLYYSWSSMDDIIAMGLDPANKGGTYWRMVNRSSKALAAGVTNGKAYVYMLPTNSRTIFSPPSQHPQDFDPAAGGQATNGEIWYYSELPTLMRNPSISQIIMFYQEGGIFKQVVAWDVDRDTDKPRTFLTDTPMDATPIILPAAIGRPPLKRGEQVQQPQRVW